MRTFKGLLCLCAAAGVPACIHEVKLDEQVIRVPDGRATGPIGVRLPRRAAHGEHDLRIEVSYYGRCDPRFEVEFPDGEHEALGANDPEWQALLERRAQGEAVPVPPPAPAPQQALPAYGHYEATATEAWPGQLRYLALRATRCGGAAALYQRSHYLGFEEKDRLTVYARVPQDVEGGVLHVVTWDVGAPPPQQRPEPPASEKPRPVDSPQEWVAGRVQAPRGAMEPKPKPKPKIERPGKPGVPGATFHPGHWAWVEGNGHWEWLPGYWLAPAGGPPTHVEHPGPPRIAGAMWHNGSWRWIGEDGHWEWEGGHYEAPAPLKETLGAPPVTGQPWIQGRWIITDARYLWLAGHFGPPPSAPRPPRRTETPPPPPYPGARFLPGDWILRDGKWQWLPGAYEGTDRPPPAARAETPPPPPALGAVWLSGYHRWDVTRADYLWVPGHWESAPGEGYIWVPDAGPLRARSFGHWALRIFVPIRER